MPDSKISTGKLTIKKFAVSLSELKTITTKESIDKATHILVPWVHKIFPSILDWKKHWKGRGIVIPAYGNQLFQLKFLFASLHQVGCKLPITIAHNNNEWTDKQKTELLSFIGGKLSIEFLQVEDWIDSSVYKNQKKGKSGVGNSGWAVKPFALFASQYKEVILVDADVIFYSNPEELFDIQGYKDTRAIFFPDHIVLFDTYHFKKEWFMSVIPKARPSFLNNQAITGVSNEGQESSVVVMDKSAHILGLMMSCHLNGPEQHALYTNSLGDKESFWFGFELVEESYYWYPMPTSVVGIRDDGSVCPAYCLHTDEDEKFLWSNGGGFLNKKAENPLVLPYIDSYVVCRDPKGFEYIHPHWCKTSDDIKPVPETYRNFFHKLTVIYSDGKL
eukprot:TRINITY_DN9136_c0_g1_i1.p1 TRINITY_DN9136_c0_g1~~TRINITY_DN9136_c0_g1_i1.p1  ORF type:complete len:389 (+),score=67.27 TRINITY_DN9136_c0_g1_i1:74-1240(+)